MTLLPIQTVRKIYDDQTLAIIENLIGGTPHALASDPIASQSLDPHSWRSMRKGPLHMNGMGKTDLNRSFAQAIAYDRYLPTIVLTRARKMQLAMGMAGPLEAVYFPDAVGILHYPDTRLHFEGPSSLGEERMCLVVRDINSSREFVSRYDPFQKTLRQWLDRLHDTSIPLTGMKLPRIEDLARTACGEPLEPT